MQGEAGKSSALHPVAGGAADYSVVSDMKA